MSATSFYYVRRTYGVPAKRGMRVTVDGKPGRITRGRGHYVMVRFDGMKRSTFCHPTWRVTYYAPNGAVLLDTTTPTADAPRSHDE